jgi:hypothetical protein
MSFRFQEHRKTPSFKFELFNFIRTDQYLNAETILTIQIIAKAIPSADSIDEIDSAAYAGL